MIDRLKEIKRVKKRRGIMRERKRERERERREREKCEWLFLLRFHLKVV